jgi:hypothetical protein
VIANRYLAGLRGNAANRTQGNEGRKSVSQFSNVEEALGFSRRI